MMPYFDKRKTIINLENISLLPTGPTDLKEKRLTYSFKFTKNSLNKTMKSYNVIKFDGDFIPSELSLDVDCFFDTSLLQD